MMHNRYQNSPSGRDIGKPEPHTVIRYDQETQEKYDGLLQKRSELNATLRAGLGKQDDLIQAMGLAIASGCDWKAIGAELSEMRLEGEALESGILYLDGQVQLMERLHHWLK